MKNSKKQTAVEWLEMEIVKLETKFAIPGNIYQLCEEAKEMEKEQLADAWYAGDEDGPMHDFEDYYRETYKKD